MEFWEELMARNIALAAAALTLGATTVSAGGIDRSGQDIGLLFEDGNAVEFTFGYISPSVSGVDIASVPTGNVVDSHLEFGIGYKQQVNDQLSFALILDQPYGADLLYPDASPVLGGTLAEANSIALTGIARYEFDGGFSVHGGVRAQRSDANVALNGLAYGGVSGYAVDLATDTSFGYLIGAAYEIPAIAFRLAVTYNSAITHEFATVETLGGAPIGMGTTDVETPQSVNVDFQTGIAQDTLLFASIRWVEWSSFLLEPETFVGLTGGGLIDLDDTTTYELGVGRQFTDRFAGSIAVQFEEEGDPLVSPLAPTTGRLGVTLAGSYALNDNSEIGFGVNYTQLGDAMPETGTPDTARADFTNNDSWGVGLRYLYSF